MRSFGIGSSIFVGRGKKRLCYSHSQYLFLLSSSVKKKKKKKKASHESGKRVFKWVLIRDLAGFDTGRILS